MLKNALLASALGLSIYALASGATAGQRPVGWYVGAEGGGTWTDDADLDFSNGIGTTWEAEFEDGWAALAEVGYRFDNNWRIELEGGYRENDIDCISFGGPCFAGSWGEVSQFTQMLNVIFDVPVGPHTDLSFGLGFGGNFVEAKVPVLSDDEDYVFAGQALVQLSQHVSERISLVLSYRYMTSEDPEFRLFAPVAVDYENENHTVSVGFRYDLYADPEPVMAPVTTMPEPPPPPAEPRQFIVYFGFNKTHLDAKAIEVVKEAAATALNGGFVSIVVTGHTDTIGSSAYNMRLSKRRAKAVSKALVDEGVPAQNITSTGKGESELLVQTGDREMEPRNRRATIDLN